MAKLKSQTVILKKDTPKVSRPGVHAKTKTSKLKSNFKHFHRQLRFYY